MRYRTSLLICVLACQVHPTVPLSDLADWTDADLDPTMPQMDDWWHEDDEGFENKYPIFPSSRPCHKSVLNYRRYLLKQLQEQETIRTKQINVSFFISQPLTPTTTFFIPDTVQLQVRLQSLYILAVLPVVRTVI